METLIGEIQSVLLHTQVSHWQTKSYPTHIALGELYTNLNESLDAFVEALIGGERWLLNLGGTIEITDALDNNSIVGKLNGLLARLGIVDEMDLPSDILNLRDEMSEDIKHTLYLLRFV